MSSLIIPPPLTKGEPADWQHASDLQQYYQRNLRLEVLRFDLPTVSGTVTFANNLLRIPSTRGTIAKVRAYALIAGSGSITFDVVNTSNSIWAAFGDRITLSSITLVEKVPTSIYTLADPDDVTQQGRIYVSVTAFSGTAWTGVVVEVLLYPISNG